MESGVGCSAALSLLYMEVCARLGVSMAAKPLERGRCVLEVYRAMCVEVQQAGGVPHIGHIGGYGDS